jgi:hypothetical protein
MNGEITIIKGINKVSKSVIYVGLLALLLGVIAIVYWH